MEGYNFMIFLYSIYKVILIFGKLLLNKLKDYLVNELLLLKNRKKL